MNQPLQQERVASRNYRRREAAAYIREKYNVPCAEATLATSASRGGGPWFYLFGRIPIYPEQSLDSWVEARMGAPVRSTSEARNVPGEPLRKAPTLSTTPVGTDASNARLPPSGPLTANQRHTALASPDGHQVLAGKNKMLARFEARLHDLDAAVQLGDIADIDRDLDLIERYAREAGLLQPVELVEFRLGRFIARWKLGEALAKIVRAPGATSELVRVGTRFAEVLSKIGVGSRQAQAAQRVACLPYSELEAFCQRMRLRDDLPSFSELLIEAKPYWYQQSRKDKHRSIRSRADVCGPFPLIYADPPWGFAVDNDKGLERTPDQHCETLSDHDIGTFMIGDKLVREIAAPQAALLMWCTSSNMKRALAVMEEEWDFEFKASAAWVKDRSGLGLVFRDQHEVLLYGTRGDMPGPQYQPPSVFEYPIGEHSAKPPEIRAEIEQMYPDFDADRRLELFARGEIEGWTTYGFEAAH
jgi:N6-adenosine-specific RNA methylase IME4